MAKVYLSSTYADLEEYRQAVFDTLQKLQLQVVAMERYVARDDRPLDACLKDVEGCGLYVGIFAWRYGYVPDEDNPDRLSITEREYRHAKDKGIPRLVFLLDEDQAWPPKWTDSHTGDGDNGNRIRALREELGKGRLASFFTSPEKLANLVSIAVTNALSSTSLSKEKAPPRWQGPPTVPPAYLNWLKTQISDISVLGLDPKEAHNVRLPELYVPALTAARPEGDEKRHPRPDLERRAFDLLLTRLNQTSPYVPGAPGAGKSTFCSWVCWVVADRASPSDSHAIPEGPLRCACSVRSNDCPCKGGLAQPFSCPHAGHRGSSALCSRWRLEDGGVRKLTPPYALASGGNLRRVG